MQGENERQWKKVSGHTYDISSKKRVTKKFLKVSRCSCAKHRQRNEQKMWAARAKLLCWLDLSLFFTVFRSCMPSPLRITRFYILFEQTINIIESFAFSPSQFYILCLFLAMCESCITKAYTGLSIAGKGGFLCWFGPRRSQRVRVLEG